MVCATLRGAPSGELTKLPKANYEHQTWATSLTTAANETEHKTFKLKLPNFSHSAIEKLIRITKSLKFASEDEKAMCLQSKVHNHTPLPHLYNYNYAYSSSCRYNFYFKYCYIHFHNLLLIFFKSLTTI